MSTFVGIGLGPIQTGIFLAGAAALPDAPGGTGADPFYAGPNALYSWAGGDGRRPGGGHDLVRGESHSGG